MLTLLTLLFPLIQLTFPHHSPLTWGSQGEQQEGSKDEAEEPHGWAGAEISARLEQEAWRELRAVSATAGDPLIYRAERRLWGRFCCSGHLSWVTAQPAAPPPCSWQNSALPSPGSSPRFKGRPWSVTGEDGTDVLGHRDLAGSKISITGPFPTFGRDAAGLGCGQDALTALVSGAVPTRAGHSERTQCPCHPRGIHECKSLW